MAVVNDSTNGLFLSRGGNTQSGVRYYTRSRTQPSGGTSNREMIQVSHAAGGTNNTFGVWIMAWSERDDGTWGYSSSQMYKSAILWNGSYMDIRYQDGYGAQSRGFDLYPSITQTSNYFTIITHVYGNPGFTTRSTFTTWILYSRWDLVTISYP